MRALAFRAADGTASALVQVGAQKPGGSGFEIRSVRVDTNGFGQIFDTLTQDIIMVVEAELVGGGVHIVGTHGGFSAVPKTAAILAEDAVKSRDEAVALESRADRVWKGPSDDGSFTLGVNRGARSIRG